MKFGQRLAATILIMPGALYAGDFNNPTPYGTSGSQSSGSSAFSMVSVGTAETLRIANMNVGQPTSVYYYYKQDTTVNVGDVTFGDNNHDFAITSNADGLCVNSTNNILNSPELPTDQTCDGVQN